MSNQKKCLYSKKLYHLNLIDLPLDCIKMIFSNVDIYEVRDVVLICKLIYNIYNDPHFCVLFMKVHKIKFDYNFFICNYKIIIEVIPESKFYFYEDKIQKFLFRLIR